VNADEAAVFGAAFKAARLSPSFRVKEIREFDAANYATWLSYKKGKDGKTQQQKLFTPSSFVGTSKQVPFNQQEDFEFYLYQSRLADKGSPFENNDSGTTGSRYTTKNVTASIEKLVKDFGCKKEDVDLKFTIRLEPVFGLPEVVHGSVSCEYEVTDKKEGVVDGVKNLFGFGKKTDDGQKILADEKEASSSSTSSESSSTSSAKSTETTAKGKKDGKAKDGKAKEAKAKEDTAPKKKTAVIQVAFDTVHDASSVIPFAEQTFIKER